MRTPAFLVIALACAWSATGLYGAYRAHQESTELYAAERLAHDAALSAGSRCDSQGPNGPACDEAGKRWAAYDRAANARETRDSDRLLALSFAAGGPIILAIGYLVSRRNRRTA